MLVSWDYASSDIVEIMLEFMVYHEFFSILDHIGADEDHVANPSTAAPSEVFCYFIIGRGNNFKEVVRVTIGDLTTVDNGNTVALSCVMP